VSNYYDRMDKMRKYLAFDIEIAKEIPVLNFMGG
jgi:hypothetical protein